MCAEKPAGLPGAAKGTRPIAFNPTRDSLYSRSGERWLTAESCRECHAQVYENWQNSRHREAFTNQLYKESHAREPMEWCVNCHAPLALPESNPDRPVRVLASEGISCNVCHVRGGEVLVSQLPRNERLEHKYRVVSGMNTSEMCAACHQFDFPDLHSTQPGAPVRFTGLPMQNTFEEWKNGGLSGVSCQGCHLLSGTSETHSFPGGHNLRKLEQAFQVTVSRSSIGTARAEILMVGVGHNFPTGDLFRAMRIRVFDGSNLIHEETLKKEFANLPPDRLRANGPTKFLVHDSTIPAPLSGDHASGRSFEFRVKPGTRLLRIDLHMDYLHGANHFLTHMPAEETQPRFKTVYVILDAAEPDLHG